METCIGRKYEYESDDVSWCGDGNKYGGKLVQDVFSAGDALRRVFQLQLIRSDPFVMMSGDVVTNVNLKGILAAHQVAREADKTFIMSCLMTQAPMGVSSRDLNDELVVSYSEKGQLLLYNNEGEDCFEVPVELLLQNEQIIRSDLVDCRIDVCSEEVLSLFNKDFDFQDIREHFVRGVLDDNVMGDKIRVHIEKGYAARITDFRTYDNVSKDILQRYAHPFVPDSNFSNKTRFIYSRGNIYKENVTIAKSSSIGSNCLIGNGSIIGENVVIRNSVVGPNCFIRMLLIIVL